MVKNLAIKMPKKTLLTNKTHEVRSLLKNAMHMTTFLEKQERMLQFFAASSSDERYEKLIVFGRQQPKLPLLYKTPENLVSGCQSNLYLHGYIQDNLIYFAAESDALISAGLAAILTNVYSGESLETVLTEPPLFIESLGLQATLSPNRAHGLSSIHLRMKQEALKFLVARAKKGASAS